MQCHKCFSQSCVVDKQWLLLDSCSSISCVTNKDLLSNLQNCVPRNEICVYTNGGTIDYTQEGDLSMFPFTVYYNPDSIANILSLKDVANSFRVTMDSASGKEMIVHCPDQTTLHFKECGDGLYYLNTADLDNFTNSSVIGYSLLNTVADNQNYFTRREVEGAECPKFTRNIILAI